MVVPLVMRYGFGEAMTAGVPNLVGVAVGGGVTGGVVDGVGVSSATLAWLTTLTILVGSRGFLVVLATAICCCSSSTIKSKLASGVSKPVKKSDVLTNFAM